MAWTTPRTWATSELVTAAMMNANVRDNSNFLHDTHGPIWIPATEWILTAQPAVTIRGSDPDSLAIVGFSGSNTAWFHATRLLPDDWISGGITWKYHYRKTATADANDFAIQLQYGQIAITEDALAVGGNVDKTFTPTNDLNYRVETLGTGAAPSAGDLIRLAVRRDGLSGADTSIDGCDFIGLEGEYT